MPPRKATGQVVDDGIGCAAFRSALNELTTYIRAYARFEADVLGPDNCRLVPSARR